MNLDEKSLELHKKNRGKLEIRSKVSIKNRDDLSLAYTPGVAAVSRAIAENKSRVYEYTMKQNTVAVVSDGSAVLGLGNIGPEAAIPVMEGKCVLFKEFGNVDAVPICLATQDADEIVATVRRISPVFGGINLEDISAPRCFDVEERLQGIGIPVMHDDQHGTAIVLLAAIINAAKLAGKNLEDMRVVINGAGAAGSAIAKILLCLGYDKKICTSVKEIILLDSKGAIYEGRGNLDKFKKEIAKSTNPKKRKGRLDDVIEGSDVFVGVSVGNILTKEMIRKMAGKPIVFAMANPTPEISPEEGSKAAFIFGSGRSDYPNQINNVLAFPAVFRGALDAKATQINSEMKLAAAYALAECMKPTREKILPAPFDNYVPAVANAVKKAAIETGAVRK